MGGKSRNGKGQFTPRKGGGKPTPAAPKPPTPKQR